jgi:hypothetical protein
MDTTDIEMTDILDSIEPDEPYEPYEPYEPTSVEIEDVEIEDGDIEVDENKTSSQHTLNDYLKDVDDDIEYIHLDKNLYGVLDLSVISINHKNVKHIYLGEGNITEIINFPESLKRFECAKNLLSSLQDLPTGIIEIDVSHNMITTIDLKELTMLQKLRCSWNRLSCLNELPDSIIEIIVDNNSITEIDLSGLVNLERVDCANNTGIIVKNVPTGVTLDIDMKGGANDVDDENNPDISYDDLLNNYYLLKATYEKNKSDIIKKYKNNPENGLTRNEDRTVQVKCVNCNKNGGTIFKKDKKIYTIECGSKNKKCSKIRIDMTNVSIRNLEESMNNAKKNVEKSKEDIIKQKMDTLFGYIQEKESSAVFLKKAAEYTKKNLQYEEHLKEFNDIFHRAELDSVKKETQEMTQEINGFNEEMEKNKSLLSSTTDNERRKELIEELVGLQIKSGKKHEELTKTKYKVNYVKIESLKEKKEGEEGNDEPQKKSKCVRSVVKFEDGFVRVVN